MRLTYGKLTRRLPRAVPTTQDVMVVKTYYCGSRPDAFHVVSVLRDGDDGMRLRLSGGFQRRKDAIRAVWRLMPDGGRLLDYQRGVLAEQPYLWSVSFRRDRIPVEEQTLFNRRQRGEGWLIAALEAWAGLPRADARTLARLLVAHGSTTYPLTQTETRRALVPMEQREGVRRRVLSMWALLDAYPAEVLPAALREPVQLPGPTRAPEDAHA